MSVVLTVFIILASLLMIGIVLVQKSKGGGLASNFASSNQIMGVRKTTDFLEKATWTLAGTVVVLSIVITAFIPRAQHANQSEIKEQINTYIFVLFFSVNNQLFQKSNLVCKVNIFFWIFQV